MSKSAIIDILGLVGGSINNLNYKLCEMSTQDPMMLAMAHQLNDIMTTMRQMGIFAVSLCSSDMAKGAIYDYGALLNRIALQLESMSSLYILRPQLKYHLMGMIINTHLIIHNSIMRLMSLDEVMANVLYNEFKQSSMCTTSTKLLCTPVPRRKCNCDLFFNSARLMPIANLTKFNVSLNMLRSFITMPDELDDIVLRGSIANYSFEINYALLFLRHMFKLLLSQHPNDNYLRLEFDIFKKAEKIIKRLLSYEILERAHIPVQSPIAKCDSTNNTIKNIQSSLRLLNGLMGKYT